MHSKKTQDYIQKLQDKNIKIIPLEPYIRSTDKIKHRCECGKEYQQTPKRTLLNNKCGCNTGGRQKPTTEEFNKKLKDKGIKTKIIGEYKDIFVKTKCLCECGNEWLAEPRNILSGKRCGCRKLLHEEELYKDKPTVLYYIKIGELYKIGIAMMQKSKDEISAVEARYNKDVKLGLEYTILDYKLYKNGYTAYKKEQQILMDNINNRYIGEKILIGGNTELFDINILSNTKL